MKKLNSLHTRKTSTPRLSKSKRRNPLSRSLKRLQNEYYGVKRFLKALKWELSYPETTASRVSEPLRVAVRAATLEPGEPPTPSRKSAQSSFYALANKVPVHWGMLPMSWESVGAHSQSSTVTGEKKIKSPSKTTGGTDDSDIPSHRRRAHTRSRGSV